MKCPRCSAEIPTQSQFCLRCGTPIHGTAVNPSGVSSPNLIAPRPNNRPYLIAGAVLLALLAGGVGALVVRGSMVQKPAQSSTSTLVQAPGQSSTSTLVQAPAESEPTKVVQAPTETAPTPADVVDYLAFLKRIEASKQALIRKQMGDALALLAQAKALSAYIDENDYNNTVNNFNKGTSYNADEWNQLTAAFQQRTPPPSCQDLHNKYYDQLGKVQAAMVEINDAFSKIQSDPQTALHELTQMQGKVSAEIDEAVMKADDALAEVCAKYKLRKDFDIKGDSSSGASLFR